MFKKVNSPEYIIFEPKVGLASANPVRTNRWGWKEYFYRPSVIFFTQLNSAIVFFLNACMYGAEYCSYAIQFHNKLREEAKERGEKYRVTKLRRNIEMDEYDFVHWRRSLEEREALIRDISR